MSTSPLSSSSPSSTSIFDASAIPTGNNTTSTSIDGYIIALSVLGGITLLSLFGLIAFWCIQRRRRNNKRINESFWQTWHLKAYSRVDSPASSSKDSPDMSQYGQQQRRGYDEHDDNNDNDYNDDMEMGTEKRGSVIMDWWYGGRNSIMKMVEEGFEVESSSLSSKDDGEKLKKKKKQKLGTVHKVKRYKPNESFEIDSDVRLSVVDLSLTPSRSR